jgi:hypothetical protein
MSCPGRPPSRLTAARAYFALPGAISDVCRMLTVFMRTVADSG